MVNACCPRNHQSAAAANLRPAVNATRNTTGFVRAIMTIPVKNDPLIRFTCRRCQCVMLIPNIRGSWSKRYCEPCRKLVRRDKDRVGYQKYREERIAKRRAYYQLNKEAVIETNRRWKANNSAAVKLMRHRRDKRLKTARQDGSVTSAALEELLSFQYNSCNECLKDIVSCWTIDHIIPLSKGGSHTIENIQLLCHNCNSMKHDRILEKDIQYTILQYLKLKGYFVWKNNVSGIKKPNGSYIPSSSKGTSDILGISPDGKLIALEVKKPSTRTHTTPAQDAFLAEVRSRGGYAGVVCSTEDVDRLLAPSRR